MKRIIVRKPVNFTPERLTPEQRDGIKRVFTQWVIMPGTVPHDGFDLIDGVVGDNFDPQALSDLGLPFEMVGLWQWDGYDAVQTLVPLNVSTMLTHLPPAVEYDDEGNVVSVTPVSEVFIPHSWAGWPALEG